MAEQAQESAALAQGTVAILAIAEDLPLLDHVETLLALFIHVASLDRDFVLVEFDSDAVLLESAETVLSLCLEPIKLLPFDLVLEMQSKVLEREVSDDVFDSRQRETIEGLPVDNEDLL